MQCMACVEICPVGIEHVPIINQLRRRLVERGEMDPQLQPTLETIYEIGQLLRRAEAQARPLGEGARLRDQGRAQGAGRASSGSSATTRPSTRATSASRRRSRGSCTTRASTSGSSTTASATPATTCAASARRGSSQLLAEQNIEAISDVRRSSGSSPPTRTRSTRCGTSTRRFGGTWDVVHHSQFLLELLDDGRARAEQAARLPRHLPRPLHARPLQRGLRRAARG